MMLWIQRRLGLRMHDRHPDGRELGMHLLVWAIIAEIIGPFFLHAGVSDWKDAIAYCAGALIAWFVWDGRVCAKFANAHLV